MQTIGYIIRFYYLPVSTNFIKKADYKNLDDIFSYIIINGAELKKDNWNKSNPLLRIFADDLKSVVTSIVNNSDEQYCVVCKTGSSGKWAYTPYCAILSPHYNKTVNGCSPSKGVFPAYLLSIDCSEIYLVYMIGVGTKKEKELIKISSSIKSSYILKGYETDTTKLNFGRDIHNYCLAIIWYKKYRICDLHSNDMLKKELLDLIFFHELNGKVINSIAEEIIRSGR